MRTFVCWATHINKNVYYLSGGVFTCLKSKHKMCKQSCPLTIFSFKDKLRCCSINNQLNIHNAPLTVNSCPLSLCTPIPTKLPKGLKSLWNRLEVTITAGFNLSLKSICTPYTHFLSQPISQATSSLMMESMVCSSYFKAIVHLGSLLSAHPARADSARGCLLTRKGFQRTVECTPPVPHRAHLL